MAIGYVLAAYFQFCVLTIYSVLQVSIVDSVTGGRGAVLPYFMWLGLGCMWLTGHTLAPPQTPDIRQLAYKLCFFFMKTTWVSGM